MANKATTQDLAYIKILGKLRKLINTEYKDGGRFPSSRKMCETLQVNRNTYSKALARLIIDGYARNYHQSGIFITPDRFRCHKIGLVISRGYDSPFLVAPDQIADALNEIAKFNFQVQIIQAVSPEQIFRKAIFHGVNSLLWFYAPPNAVDIFATAKAIHTSGELPVVLVELGDPDNSVDLNCSVPHVSIDYHALGRKRAEFLIDQGHKSIVFLGNSWFGNHTGFLCELKKAGVNVNDQDPIASVTQVSNKLEAYILKEKVTAIFSEGPTELMHAALEVVSELQGKYDTLEVLIRDHPFANEVVNDFPELKGKIGVEYVTAELAKSSVAMLVIHLTEGTPLVSMRIPARHKIKI